MTGAKETWGKGHFSCIEGLLPDSKRSYGVMDFLSMRAKVPSQEAEGRKVNTACFCISMAIPVLLEPNLVSQPSPSHCYDPLCGTCL